jgi:hypothetical protein
MRDLVHVINVGGCGCDQNKKYANDWTSANFSRRPKNSATGLLSHGFNQWAAANGDGDFQDTGAQVTGVANSRVM